jgi:MFS family permease
VLSVSIANLLISVVVLANASTVAGCVFNAKDAVVTVMLLGSSLFSQFFARAETHTMRRRMLLFVRALVAFAGGSCGLAALLVSVSAPLWTLCACLILAVAASVVVQAIVISGTIVGNWSRRHVERHIEHTLKAQPEQA